MWDMHLAYLEVQGLCETNVKSRESYVLLAKLDQIRAGGFLFFQRSQQLWKALGRYGIIRANEKKNEPNQGNQRKKLLDRYL